MYNKGGIEYESFCINHHLELNYAAFLIISEREGSILFKKSEGVGCTIC